MDAATANLLLTGLVTLTGALIASAGAVTVALIRTGGKTRQELTALCGEVAAVRAHLGLLVSAEACRERHEEERETTVALEGRVTRLEDVVQLRQPRGGY